MQGNTAAATNTPPQQNSDTVEPASAAPAPGIESSNEEVDGDVDNVQLRRYTC